MHSANVDEKKTNRKPTVAHNVIKIKNHVQQSAELIFDSNKKTVKLSYSVL